MCIRDSFYGAGCGTEPPRVLIKTVFSNIFKNCSKFSVKEDTYAAIYSTAKSNTKSIVCILELGQIVLILMAIVLNKK